MNQTDVTAEQVLGFLNDNPDFLEQYPQAYGMLVPDAPPQQQVVEFRREAIARLSQKVEAHQADSAETVQMARQQQHLQHRVQQAVLTLLEALTLERFFETISVDFPVIFDVDLVRLALESPEAPFIGSPAMFAPDYAAALTLIPAGMMAELNEPEPTLRLVDDHEYEPYPAELIFAECQDLVRSAAYLPVNFPRTHQQGVLALGSRHAGCFQPGEHRQSWTFLASAVGLRGDALLEAQAMGL